MAVNQPLADERERQDYPLSEVPMAARKSLSSLSVVLLGFTFFTATMFAGGKLGPAFAFWPDLVAVIAVGNLLLGAYVGVLSLIAFRTGLNTALMRASASATSAPGSRMRCSASPRLVGTAGVPPRWRSCFCG